MHSMRILIKIIFLGLFIIQGYVFADRKEEQMHQNWIKKIKENNFHLKKARKNLNIGIKILKNDLDVPVSEEAKKLIQWAAAEYFHYLNEHKKIYSDQ